MTRRRVAYGAGASLVGLVFGGWVGLVAGAAVGVVGATRPAWLLVGAAAAPWALAVTTLVEAPATERNIARFAALRPVGHHLGMMAALVWIAAGVVLILGHAASTDAAAPTGDAGSGHRRAPWWVLAVLISAAVLGTLVLID